MLYVYENAKHKEPSCLHKACSKCHGTGLDTNGRMCVHMISCPCKSCTPSYL